MTEETQTTLRDTISEAFNAAEAPVESTPVVESTPSEATTPVETEAQVAARARDEAGRFAKEEKAKADALPAKASIEAPVTQRPPRPSSWKKDYEKDWETLNPRLAAYIDQREKEYAKGVSTYKTEWDRAKPVLEALAPYQQHLQQYGIRPEQFVQNLAAAHQALALGNPQERLQHFAKLAQDYGVDLRALMPRPPQVGPNGQPLPVPPQVALQRWLQSQIAPVRQELQQFKNAQAQQQQAQVSHDIERFKSAPGHEHFEALKDTMAMLLEKGIAQDLDEAHSLALRMPQHDDIWSAMQDEKRRADEAKRAQDAAQAVKSAKAKAVSLKSSSPGAAAATGQKSALREQYAELVGASSGRV